MSNRVYYGKFYKAWKNMRNRCNNPNNSQLTTGK